MNKGHKNRRLLCILLCLAVLLPLLPVQALGAAALFTDTFGGKTYQVMQGQMYLSASELNNASGWNNYYYSDGYFEEASTAYNAHLATMSEYLAVSAHHTFDSMMIRRHSRARQILSDIGCADESFYLNEWQNKAPDTDSMATLIGQKELAYADGTKTGYILVPIALRGGNYGDEWGGNFKLGSTGEAAGFSAAADIVMKDIQYYIDHYDLSVPLREGKVKFWIVGYSRAGAAANLAAKRLVDAYGTAAVYAYTCATPMGGSASREKAGTDYSCIHNLVNPGDLVSKAAPALLGFKRYGKDAVIQSSNSAAYEQQCTKMQQQLNLMDPGSVYDDELELYSFSINISLSGLSYGMEKTEYSFTKSDIYNVSDFLDLFFNKAVEWGIYSRSNYSKNLTLVTDSGTYSFPSVQECLQILAPLLAYGEMDLTPFTDEIDTILGCYTLAELLDMYANGLKKWDEQSDTQKYNYSQKTWNALISTQTYKDLPQNIKDTLDYVWETCFCTLMNFISKDYTTKGSSLGYSGVSGTLILTSTLIKNIGKILDNHDYYVNLPWLRSVDSYYADATVNGSPRQTQTPQPVVAHIADTVLSQSSQAPTAVTAGQKILLSCPDEKGELIQYTVEQGGTVIESGYFSGGITLPVDDGTKVYKITAREILYDTSQQETVYYAKNDPSCSVSARVYGDHIYYEAYCTDTGQGGCFLAAVVYQNGKMRRALCVPSVSFSNGAATGMLETTIPSGAEIRLFLWDSKTNIPLCIAWSQ